MIANNNNIALSLSIVSLAFSIFMAGMAFYLGTRIGIWGYIQGGLGSYLMAMVSFFGLFYLRMKGLTWKEFHDKWVE